MNEKRIGTPITRAEALRISNEIMERTERWGSEESAREARACLDRQELTVGEYTITVYDEDSFWIAKESGEAMQISKGAAEAWISQLFMSEFGQPDE